MCHLISIFRLKMGGWGAPSPPTRQSYTWQEKIFEASYALRVAQKKAPSFQNQGLSSFMLYMVPLSRIFYFSFCQGNLRVQSYDIFFAISHVDFVEKYQPHHSHSVFYHS
jgi:hypothetical protein